MNYNVGNFPIRQDITVIPPFDGWAGHPSSSYIKRIYKKRGDPYRLKLGWTIKEEVGVCMVNDHMDIPMLKKTDPNVPYEK